MAATWGDTDVKESNRMVDLALEHGINFLDTADVYSDGLSLSASLNLLARD